MAPSVVVRPLVAGDERLLEPLFRSDAECAECWCMNHRCPDGQAPTHADAQRAFAAGTAAGEIRGVLALASNAPDAEPECVGWCAVDVLSTQIGHDYLLAGRGAEPGDWAVHCLFVHATFRGQGVSGQLVDAAEALARDAGGTRLLAFPIPEANREKFPAHEAEFSGRHSTYAKRGYQDLEPLDSFYSVVAKPLV